MNESQPEIPHHTFDAVVSFPDWSLPGLRGMDIYTRDETYVGWTWLPPELFDENSVLKAQVTTVPLGDSASPIYVVTNLKACPALDAFDLIPDAFAVHEGSVFRCRDVVDAIESKFMRRFVSNVFSIHNVYHYFWTCPASQKHHHRIAGGLALHSIEVAEGVVNAPHLSSVERDFGIAYALLHDIGKLWCYKDDGTYGDPLGHEMAALDHLHTQLQQLGNDWPDGAVAMRSFLSGLWKISGRRPIMAVGKLVQALDQMSVERDLRKGCESKYKPWTPAPEWELPF